MKMNANVIAAITGSVLVRATGHPQIFDPFSW